MKVVKEQDFSISLVRSFQISISPQFSENTSMKEKVVSNPSAYKVMISKTIIHVLIIKEIRIALKH